MTVKPNTAYTISLEDLIIENLGNNNGTFYIYEYNASNVEHFITNMNKNKLEAFFTTQADTVRLRLQPYSYSGTFDTWETAQITYKNIMLCEGTDTTYSPYVANPIELCKIGDYQDVIYKENNKWYVDKYIGNVVLNGGEYWKGTTTTGVFQINGTYPSDVALRTAAPFAYMDRFVYHYYSSSIISSIHQGELSWSGAKVLTLRNIDCSTTDELKTWLSTNNITVYYVLAESTTTEITETNLINQLEAIYNAKLQSGTNTIMQLPSDLPFYLNFQYYEKG